MVSQLATAPKSHSTKSAIQTNVMDNAFGTPLPLPGFDKPLKDKESNTTFNKFKVKISFTIPREDKIKPQDKFATLFSIIQQQYKDTILEQWNAEVFDQAQSIIASADIPYKQEKLSIYCPHVRRNSRLDTQWRLQSTT
eukprot:5209029-Ditylum_brightwellii.AAC.1